LPVPEVGMMTIAPPPVDMVAEEPEGAVIVSELALLELLKTEMAVPEDLVETSEELAPRLSDGQTRVSVLDPAFSVTPSARLIPPVGSLGAALSFLICTSPPDPALKV